MTSSMEVKVPDIGGFTDVGVIDVMVEVGQKIEVDAPLITLETDKAAMDVPAPAAGVVRKISVRKGDKVSQGSSILVLEVDGAPAAVAAPVPKSAPAPVPAAAPAPAPLPAAAPAAVAPRGPVSIDEVGFSKAHASPSVRKFARELGVNLVRVTGSGPKGRISPDDVKAFVKKLLTSPGVAGAALPRVHEVDFARFGPVEVKPLSRIQRISGARLQASWINLPHVTQHEDADITDLEALRVAQTEEIAKSTRSADVVRSVR